MSRASSRGSSVQPRPTLLVGRGDHLRAALIAIAALGCGKGGEPAREPGKDAGVAAAPLDAAARSVDAAAKVTALDAAAAPPTVDAAPAPAGIACAALLPADLMAAHFPDMTMRESTAPGLPAAMCELSSERLAFGTVAVSCLDAAMTAATLDFGYSQMKDPVDLQVGKRAYVGELMGMKVINLWDEDSGCTVTAGGFTGEPLEVARALEARLTPAVAERVKAHAKQPSAEQLAAPKELCEELLPAPARRAHFPDMIVTQTASPELDHVGCTFVKGADDASLNVSCGETMFELTMSASRDMLTDPVDLAVGKRAHAGKMMGEPAFFLWHEGGCIVTGIGFAGGAEALARSVHGGLTPSIIAAIMGS